MGLTRILTNNFLLANILIILFAKPSPICATSQVLTLYSNDGRSVKISGRNVQNLEDLNFDNTAVRAEVEGTWILFAGYNYYGSFQLMRNTNEDLPHSLESKVSSVRLVGSSDSDLDDTITLYEGINFQGKETYNFADNSNIEGSASSLIVNGRLPWTLYAATNFGGSSICINPKLMYDTNDIGMSSIRSVRRGCLN